jgi:uncharacterized protein YbjT (DUF2867 family)
MTPLFPNSAPHATATTPQDLQTSSDTRPIVVTGATGKQGGATARLLLTRGRAVRALVRDPATPAARALEAAGAELVTGDLDDPAGLAPALDGAAGLFAIPPVAYGPTGTDVELEATRGRALIAAAAERGVEQVVLSTVATTGAETSGVRGKAAIEKYLHENIPLPTVLRPVRFMTNYLGTNPLGLDGIANGLHRHLFPPHEPFQSIALEDIAEFAALAFADPVRFAGRTLELAGDDLTPVQAAAAISAATGVPVRYEQLDEDEAAALNPEIAAIRSHWIAGHRWHADIEALRIVHPGLRTLADWLAESGAATLRARQTSVK